MSFIGMQQVPTLMVGEGCAAEVGRWLKGRGCRRPLLVSCRALHGTCQTLMKLWGTDGLEFVCLPEVDAEPTVAGFEGLRTRAGALAPDAVVGLGGGSVLDVAKLLAALLDRPEPVRAVFGIDRLPGRNLTLVCLPSTAGTGSEVSPNAILLDEATELKQGVISRHLVPDAAFVDPELTYSLPPAVTAATGFDALTHCIEAFANRHAHPWVDAVALQGIRWIGGYLERAVRDGSDREARRYLAYGSLCGGLCLGPVNTAAVHALAYPLGGRYRVAHGVANAVLLPHVLRFNLEAAPDRYAEVARALGVTDGGSAEAVARRGLERLVALARACGLPRGLAELGIRREDLPELARNAMQVQRLLRNNLRPMTETDARAIYEAAF